MKTLTTKDKQSAPAVRKARSYVHHPMGPAQQAQQAEIRSILRSTGTQAKLTIGQPNDEYEEEADRIADQVMRMSDADVAQRQLEDEEDEEILQTKPLADQITPLVQRQEELPEEEEQEEVQTKPAELSLQRQPEEEEEEELLQTKSVGGQITPLVQRQQEPLDEEEEETLQTKPLTEQITPLVRRQPEDEEEEETLQAKPLADQIAPLVQRQEEPPEEEEEELQGKLKSSEQLAVTPSVESQITTLKGSGQPLHPSARSFFEPRFGSDFSHVRVHADSNASEAAKSVNARAFTVGKDIAFGSGQYSPNTSEGKKILAHELTHVVQQTSSVPRQQNIRTSSNDSEEFASGSATAHDLLPPTAQIGGNRSIFQKEIDDFRRTQSTDSANRYRLRPLAYAGAGTAISEVPNVQRQHKLEKDLGSATGIACPISTEKLKHADASLQTTFNLGGSALTAEDITNIAVFVNNWHNASIQVPVRIHGYASKDGPPRINWPLSCERAKAVAKQMQKVQPAVKLSTGQTFPAGTPGIPAGHIQTFAHGETEEFSKTALPPNRRAMVHVPTLPSLPGKVTKAPSAKLKSGPTYTPNGTIKATRTKTTLAATFKMSAEFDSNPAKSILPACGEIRQYIRWSNNNVDPKRFGHEGFLTDKTYLPNTWYEDRDQPNTRFGHRRGPHSALNIAFDQYFDKPAKASPNPLSGRFYEGSDTPNTSGSAAYIASFVGAWEFRLEAIDACNGNKVLGQDNVKINW